MQKNYVSYVGCEVVANHMQSLVGPMTAKSGIPSNKGSNDTEYQRIQGIVVSQRSVVGDDKGMVLVIQAELHDKENDEILFAYHTVYYDKIVGIMRVIRRDAVRDSIVKRS